MASSTKGTDDIETEADESGDENEVPFGFCFGASPGLPQGSAYRCLGKVG